MTKTHLSRLVEQRRKTAGQGGASLWEIAIKHGPGREDFRVEPRLLRRGSWTAAGQELPVVGDPGSGKNTFLRRVAHALAESALGVVSDAAQSRLGVPDYAGVAASGSGHRAAWLAVLPRVWCPPAEPSKALQLRERQRPPVDVHA
ncbi:MAG: hypothetical protein ACREXU_20500, partial [Gammaproteobacteria bacterium]